MCRAFSSREIALRAGDAARRSRDAMSVRRRAPRADIPRSPSVLRVLDARALRTHARGPACAARAPASKRALWRLQRGSCSTTDQQAVVVGGAAGSDFDVAQTLR